MGEAMKPIHFSSIKDIVSAGDFDDAITDGDWVEEYDEAFDLFKAI